MNLLFQILVLSLLTCATGFAAGQKNTLKAPPVELEVLPGFEATLFAKEPMIFAPAQVEVDHLGRVWVSEGANYRRNNANPDGDRIMILEDTTGDGQADKSTVFYQGHDVDAAMGMTVLGNKVIIANSPEVFILEDTDGDNKADKKTVLFTKLGGVQHDHSSHTVVVGPDGRCYFPTGNSVRGVIHDAKGDPIPDKHGLDYGSISQGKLFRFKLDGSDFEVIATKNRNPYELAVNSFGNIFVSDNDDGGSPACRLGHVLEFGDHGYGSAKSGRTGAHPRREFAHWGQNDPGIVPVFTLTGNGAPTGLTLYEGELLPKEFHGHIIACDHGQNLVRIYQRHPKGASFTASHVNLVRGKVSWFRPTDVCTASDGSVFISDWHDPSSGGHRALSTTTGRIYRVAPKGHAYQAKRYHIDSLASAIEALQSPVIAARNLAADYLRKNDSTKALQELWKSKNPVHRARALWLLADKPKVARKSLLAAMKDSSWEIRGAAVRAARLQKADLPAVLSKAVNDSSAHVRKEAATALKHDHSSVDLWVRLALQHTAGDRMMLEALGLAAEGDWDTHLSQWLLAVKDWNTPAGHDILWRARTDTSLPYYVKIISDPKTPIAESLRFFRAFDYHGKAKDAVITRLFDVSHPDADKIATYALKHLENANIKSPQIRRVVNRLLSSTMGTEDWVTLVRHYKLKDKQSDLIQLAINNPGRPFGFQALDTLMHFGGDKLFKAEYDRAEDKTTILSLVRSSRNEKAALIILPYVTDESLSGEHRLRIVRALSTTSQGSRGILKIFENGTYPKDIELETIQILATTMYANVVDWAVGEILRRNGKEPVSINMVIAMQGDSKRGEMIFNAACVTCHKVGELGNDFGPNLSAVGGKLGRYAMFDAILNPNAGIEFDYETIEITLNNGEIIMGLESSETADEYHLKLISGQIQKIAKSTIRQKKILPNSLMPEALAQALPPQELANIVAYLMELK